MVGMQARLTNCTVLSSRLTSHSPTHLSALLLMDYFFSYKNTIFRIKWQKHNFDNNIKLRGTTGTLMYQFFLKSIHLKVPNLIAPLRWVASNSFSTTASTSAQPRCLYQFWWVATVFHIPPCVAILTKHQRMAQVATCQQLCILGSWNGRWHYNIVMICGFESAIDWCIEFVWATSVR